MRHEDRRGTQHQCHQRDQDQPEPGAFRLPGLPSEIASHAAVIHPAQQGGHGIGHQLIGLQHQGKRDAQMAHASHAAGNQLYYNSEDASFDQMADYAMMDSQDFYAQLVAEN